MERLIRRVFFCALMLITPLAIAQQISVTAGSHGHCEASWELDSPPLHSLESPWGTVALGRNRDVGREWKGSTPSGIAVTIFPDGKYGKGTLVRFEFAVCQRVLASDNGTEVAYVLTPKPSLLHPGYWYLEEKGSFEVERKGDEMQLTASSSGHGLDVKLVPAKDAAPVAAPASAPAAAKQGHIAKSGPERWKFEVVMKCKDGKCVTPAGVEVRDTLP
jgi:hypothetical protein